MDSTLMFFINPSDVQQAVKSGPKSVSVDFTDTSGNDLTLVFRRGAEEILMDTLMDLKEKTLTKGNGD